MPAGFDDCVRAKGRVRTVSGPNKNQGLGENEYIHYCFLKGESFRGHVKKRDKKTKAKS